MQTKFRGLTQSSPRAAKVANMRAGAYSLTVYAEIQKGRKVTKEHRSAY